MPANVQIGSAVSKSTTDISDMRRDSAENLLHFLQLIGLCDWVVHLESFHPPWQIKTIGAQIIPCAQDDQLL